MNLKLKFARIEAGITQRELAEKLGVKENYICKIETSRTKPTESLAKKIEKTLKSKGLFDEYREA